MLNTDLVAFSPRHTAGHGDHVPNIDHMADAFASINGLRRQSVPSRRARTLTCFLHLVIESKAFQYPRRMLRHPGCASDRLLGATKMQQVPLLPAWG